MDAPQLQRTIDVDVHQDPGANGTHFDGDHRLSNSTFEGGESASVCHVHMEHGLRAGADGDADGCCDSAGEGWMGVLAGP